MASDKTEKATPKKAEESRKRGQVARSQEVNVAIGLLATFALLSTVGSSTLSSLQELMAGSLATAGNSPDLTFTEIWNIAMSGTWQSLQMLAPYLAGGGVAGILASSAQVLPKITPEVLKPRFSVMNPITGFKKFYSPRTAVGLVKDVTKVSVVGVLVYVMVKNYLPQFGGLTGKILGEDFVPLKDQAVLVEASAFGEGQGLGVAVPLLITHIHYVRTVNAGEKQLPFASLEHSSGEPSEAASATVHVVPPGHGDLFVGNRRDKFGEHQAKHDQQAAEGHDGPCCFGEANASGIRSQDFVVPGQPSERDQHRKDDGERQGFQGAVGDLPQQPAGGRIGGQV